MVGNIPQQVIASALKESQISPEGWQIVAGG